MIHASTRSYPFSTVCCLLCALESRYVKQNTLRIVNGLAAEKDPALWKSQSRADSPYPSRAFFFKPDLEAIIRKYLELEPGSDEQKNFIERRIQFTEKCIEVNDFIVHQPSR